MAHFLSIKTHYTVLPKTRRRYAMLATFSIFGSKMAAVAASWSL